MSKIYLLSSDGFWDSISTVRYANDVEGIKRLLAFDQKDSFSKNVKNVKVDLIHNKVSFESQSSWNNDPDDWDKETYQLLCIEKVNDENSKQTVKVYVMKKKHTVSGNPLYTVFIPGIDGKIKGMRKNKSPHTHSFTSYNVDSFLRDFALKDYDVDIIKYV